VRIHQYLRPGTDPHIVFNDDLPNLSGLFSNETFPRDAVAMVDNLNIRADKNILAYGNIVLGGDNVPSANDRIASDSHLRRRHSQLKEAEILDRDAISDRDHCVLNQAEFNRKFAEKILPAQRDKSLSLVGGD
jgi:hypothetical protein